MMKDRIRKISARLPAGSQPYSSVPLAKAAILIGLTHHVGQSQAGCAIALIRNKLDKRNHAHPEFVFSLLRMRALGR